MLYGLAISLDPKYRFAGGFKKDDKKPISYWCGTGWGAFGNAVKYPTREEADSVVLEYESHYWEYPIGATFHIEEEIRL
jgi:hypothetical protein